MKILEFTFTNDGRWGVSVKFVADAFDQSMSVNNVKG